MSVDDALVEQIRYYRSRAMQRGKSDLSEARALIDLFRKFALGADVLEFAAGTGFWTQQIVERDSTVTAIDAAPEALAVNRERLRDQASSVHYIVADLLRWEPRRQWDSCVGFFWLCKIPDRRLRSFLETMLLALRAGGSFFFGDKTLRTTAVRAKELETRVLEDGQEFTIVDRPRSADEFRAAFAEVGVDVDVLVMGSYTAITGTRPLA